MRALAKTGIIVLIAILLTLTFVLSCGDDEGTPPTSPSRTPTETSRPTPSETPKMTPTSKPAAKPEGTLTMAVEIIGTGRIMTQYQRGSVTDKAYYGNMQDYLVYEKRDGSGYVPGLAEEWQISPDKKSITFKLRQGVQFHDGWGELTAEDVRFTFETAFDTKLAQHTQSQEVFGYLVDRIETSGPYDLTIYLTKAFADEVLAHVSPTGHLGLGITCKAYFDQVGFEEANAKPIFSGPFRFVEYVLGDHLSLEAVEDHWRVVPEFKTLVFKEVPELFTRVAMVHTGEADIVAITTDQAKALGAGGLQIVSAPRALYQDIVLLGQWLPSVPTYNSELPWLNKNVREAMNLAIDREALVEHLFSGYAVSIACRTQSPWGDALDPYPYDPERAKTLLAEAGYPDGFDLEIWVIAYGMTSPEMPNLVAAVAAFWETIGIDSTITPVNIAAIYGDIIKRETSGKCMGTGTTRRGQPYGIEFSSWAYSKANVFPLYESEETDAMIDAFKAASTLEERNGLAEQINQHLYDEYALVPLIALDLLWATGDDVSNWEPFHPNYWYLEYVTHAEPLGTFRLFEP